MHALDGRPESPWTGNRPSTSYPQLQEKLSVDVAVIGGGIVGLTTALEAVRSGSSVALLEGRQIGRQVTGRSTAKITTQHGLIYRYLMDTVGREKAQLYVDANQDGFRFIETTIASNNIQCCLEERSAFVWIGVDREGLYELEAEAEAALELGLEADIVDRVPLPFATGGGLRFTRQAQFNPAQYMIGLANVFERAGGRLFEYSRAVGVSKSDGRWRVKTDSGAVTADHVVQATNIPFAGEPDFTVLTNPRSHVAAAFRISAERAPNGMFVSRNGPCRSLRTGWDEDGLFLIALSPKFDTGHELDVARRIHELEHWVREHFEVGKLLWRWTNEDYDTQDRLPFAGEVSGQNGRLYVATGFNAWGITNGTAAGLLIAEQIAGRRPAIGSVFDPCRKAQDIGHTASHIRKEQSSVAAIQAGDGAIVSTGDKKLAVYKTESGIVRALSAACTHAGCTVTWNNADKTWDCPCHGSIFSLEGRVIHGPATKDLEECAPPA